MVVTDALVEALQRERIRAVVDVTDPEPLPAGASAVVGAQLHDHATCRRVDARVYPSGVSIWSGAGEAVYRR